MSAQTGQGPADEFGIAISQFCDVKERAGCCVATVSGVTWASETCGLASGGRWATMGEGKSSHAFWPFTAADCQPLRPLFPRLPPLPPLPPLPLFEPVCFDFCLLLPCRASPFLHSVAGCPAIPHLLHAWMRSALGHVAGPQAPTRICPLHWPRLHN